jgi:hypothetical protein
MYHHDERDYGFAVTEAAKTMRGRLHNQIVEARETAQNALVRIQEEIPTDSIARAKVLEFESKDDDTFVMGVKTTDGKALDFALHPWALGQVAEYARIPKNYLASLQGLRAGDDRWGSRLAAHNLNEIFRNLPAEERRLVRSVDDEARGFLSTKYKRRHPGQMLDGFLHACKKNSLLPHSVTVTDTKHMVRAVLDGIVEPVPNECLGVGVVYAESPYGNGATSVSIFVQRMWCTNLAVMSTDLRSAHVGGRLSDDFEWSEETYLADTRATTLQIQDMLESYVSPKAINRLSQTVRLAHETKIEPKQFEAFIKKNLSKDDAEAVADAYRGADVEMLPAGNSVWRASNALSFFAHSVKDEEKKYDLQKLAGQLLSPMAKAVS